MELVKHTEEIFTVDNFLTPIECQELIDFSEGKGYEDAKINMGFSGQVVNKSVRNNERYIYDSVELATKMWDRVKAFVPKEVDGWEASGLNERFRFYKYIKGQRFRMHRDGSYLKSFNEWSYYTFMIYLNEQGIIGGETKFIDLSISPERGKALVFKHELLHEGCPIIEGVKYVLRTDVMYKLQL